jgi:putative endonuclease
VGRKFESYLGSKKRGSYLFFFAAMFYIYILYSQRADRYYIGHTDEPARRVEEHNTIIKNSYTSKFRPWIRKVYFPVSNSRGEARKTEFYLKKMKSRVLIEKLILNPNEFSKILKLVRAIPTCRD